MAAPFERTSVPGIYRRGGRYVVTFTDDAGVRRKRSAATMAEARVLRGQLTADIARGEYRPTPKATKQYSPTIDAQFHAQKTRNCISKRRLGLALSALLQTLARNYKDEKPHQTIRMGIFRIIPESSGLSY